MSRRDLADVWECTVANISQIETGKRAPTLTQLMQFAGRTGVSVDALLAGVRLKDPKAKGKAS